MAPKQSDQNPWITVKTFLTRAEAEVAKSFLAANGINAKVRADDAGGMRPTMSMGSGADLQVEHTNLKKAADLLPK
jgi:hypothetical protein